MTAVIKKLFAGAILSVGLLISGAGVASAAGIPDATATGAVSIGASSAALNASIEPNGAQTEYWMEFGTSSNFERATNRYPVSGTTGSVSVSQTVTNLSASTTYYYRVKAQNSHGTATSNVKTFVTSGNPSDNTAAPEVSISSASSVSQNSAVLNGSVDPNGLSTTYKFEYGTNDFGNSVSGTVSGDGEQSISKTVSGLSAGTTYKFRIVAVNSKGTSTSNVKTFTTSNSSEPGDDTAAPEANALNATSVSDYSAVLNGSVDPNNLGTTYRFEYGINDFTNSTPSFVVNGNGLQNVSYAVSGLQSGTTYKFRVVATNSEGSDTSSVKTFTTSSGGNVNPNPNGGAPTVSINSAYGVTIDSATLQGNVNPNGTWTEYWFEYGTNNNNLSQWTTKWSVSGSAWSTPVTTSVYNLLGNATYYYRLAARNSYGTAYSNTWSFTTGNGGGYYGSPYIRTNNATSVYDTSAVLNGEVTPNNSETTVWFEYGYAGQSLNRSSSSLTYSASSSARAVSVSITGLSMGTRYDYRAVARNIYGTVYGEIVSFTASGNGSQTGSPIVSTGNATSVGKNASLLWANVNPQNSGSTLWFEYGTSAFNLNLRSSGYTIPSYTGAKDYYNSISGLQADTLYFYRAVAQNAYGTNRGEVKFFRTVSGGVIVEPPIVEPPVIEPSEDLNVFLDPSLSNLEPKAGNTVDYVLTYRNASKAKITAASLKVTLPFEAEYVDASVAPTSRVGNNITFYIGDIEKGNQGAIIIKAKVKDDAEAGSSLMFNSVLEFTDSEDDFQTVTSFIAASVDEADKLGFLASLSAFAGSMPGGWLFLILFIIMLITIIYLVVSRRKDRKAAAIAAAQAAQNTQ